MQIITKTLKIHLTPCLADISQIEQFLAAESEKGRSISGLRDRDYYLTIQRIKSLQQNERIYEVLNHKHMFRDCFFVKYKAQRIYSFTIQN